MPRKSKQIVLSPKKTAAVARKELLNEKIKTPEEVAADNKAALVKYNVPAKEKFKVVDPITKEERTVTLSRTGTQEEDLVRALTDPSLTRDQKDHATSMYLWGRGAESSSMMIDLMRYKGQHTKETRVFKSQMRFDFEAFMKIVSDHLLEQANRTASILNVDLLKEAGNYREWLSLPNNKGKEYTYWDFRHAKNLWEDNQSNRIFCAMVSQALFDLSEATRISQSRDNIAKAREAEKGGGIYVSKAGKIYTVADPEMDEVVKADREATEKIKKDKDL